MEKASRRCELAFLAPIGAVRKERCVENPCRTDFSNLPDEEELGVMPYCLQWPRSIGRDAAGRSFMDTSQSRGLFGQTSLVDSFEATRPPRYMVLSRNFDNSHHETPHTVTCLAAMLEHCINMSRAFITL